MAEIHDSVVRIRVLLVAVTGYISRQSVVLPDWRGPVSVMMGKTLNVLEKDDVNILLMNCLFMVRTNLKLYLKFGERYCFFLLTTKYFRKK